MLTMPEDDPLFIACLLEFLYTGSYQTPLFSEEYANLAKYKVFMEGLYHARVLVIAEKYGFHDLCCEAAGNIKDCQDQYPGSDADRLEFFVQLYEMSGPGSALRLHPENPNHKPGVGVRIGHTIGPGSALRLHPENPNHKPGVGVRIGHTIISIWRNPINRDLVEEASQRCPDLEEDVEKVAEWLEF